MSSSETCDCTTEDSSLSKDSNSKVNSDKQSCEPPYTIIQLQLSKSALNLLPSSTSSESSTCDQANVAKKTGDNDSCTCASEDKSSLKTCTSSSKEKDSLKSCTCTICTSKESLKTCICSDSCESRESETTADSEQEKVLEYTLAIIKPEAMVFRNEIEREIIDEGFKICQRRWLRLTPEQVSDFYRDNYKQKNFARLVSYMSSDPILVFILSKCSAIKEWKYLMGPKKVSNAIMYAPDSIRGKYGRKGDDMKNAVHGSENQSAAEREINFFFPDRIKEPMLNEEDAVEYLKKYVNEPLADGLIKCCEEKPDDPVTWLGNWLLENNSKKPKYL